jgi:hypothetical protein
MVELFDKLASLADTSSEPGKQEAEVHYEQALAILRRLDTESRLPPNCMDWTRTIETKISTQNCKEWIGIIEAKMKALGE